MLSSVFARLLAAVVCTQNHSDFQLSLHDFKLAAYENWPGFDDETHSSSNISPFKPNILLDFLPFRLD